MIPKIKAILLILIVLLVWGIIGFIKKWGDWLKRTNPKKKK